MSFTNNIQATMLFVVFVVVVIFLRVIILMWKSYNEQDHGRRKLKHVKTAIVIGSGGHTSEMLRLIRAFNAKLYSPRIYILAQGDTTSENKIHVTEESLDYSACTSNYMLVRIPRSRRVGQSYISSIFTTLFSIMYCIPVMLKERPDLVLCNGPGTCVPICLIAFIMKVFCLCDVTIVFVESVCRVTSLSLSGKILLYFADVMFVQWPTLQVIYKRAKYIGRLV